jgi:anthranilate synthase component 1
MTVFKIKTYRKKILADTLTPVSIYQKIRDKYSNSVLLESSDYGANDNSYAYVCFNPISSFKVYNNLIEKKYPDNSTKQTKLTKSNLVVDELDNYFKIFQTEKSDAKFFENGLIGYINYDAVEHFENINFESKENDIKIPEIFYAFYSNIIIINVFNNEALLLHHSFNQKNNLKEIEELLKSNKISKFDFHKSGNITSNLKDNEYIDLVKKGIKHCKRGDVFQIVLSRKFKQSFEGDEFNLYRALRSINPSPYLFYFDYGSYKIFGSSPEAQLVVKNSKAEIHPIAGTFIRTGNDVEDSIKAKKLAVDQKENSEHMMLVDLARNDLSRNGNNVKVEKDREIQFYSHVIHLVSKVTAEKKNNSSTFQIVADTFPAGTLSGAPKHKAIQLISKYENSNRSFYGGAIGFMDFEGNFNHAIIIRSFLSKNHELIFQAGAGIVSKSDPKSELQEINNKLGALIKALDLAEKI